MNQSEYKIRNLESSILYIQEEYANTLKLLHEEIKDLQMKNSELSFQIAMQNVALPNDFNSPERETERLNLSQEIERLKAEIVKLNLENDSKRQKLESYEKQVHKLTDGINKLKQAQKDEMVAVETELNNKSAEIVLLSTKLHNWKKYEIKKSNQQQQQSGSEKCPLAPQMPSAPSKIFKIRNQISVHPDDDNLKRRPIIARQAYSISSAYPMKNKSIPPLPECAVATEEIANFSKSIKRPTVLPPINSSTRGSYSPGGVLVSRVVPVLPSRSLPPPPPPPCPDRSSTVDISIYPQESALESLHTCCQLNNYDNILMRSLGDGRSGHDDSATATATAAAATATATATIDITATRYAPIKSVDIDKLMDVNNSSLLSSTAAPQPLQSVQCSLFRDHSSS